MTDDVKPNESVVNFLESVMSGGDEDQSSPRSQNTDDLQEEGENIIFQSSYNKLLPVQKYSPSPNRKALQLKFQSSYAVLSQIKEEEYENQETQTGFTSLINKNNHSSTLSTTLQQQHQQIKNNLGNQLALKRRGTLAPQKFMSTIEPKKSSIPIHQGHSNNAFQLTLDHNKNVFSQQTNNRFVVIEELESSAKQHSLVTAQFGELNYDTHLDVHTIPFDSQNSNSYNNNTVSLHNNNENINLLSSPQHVEKNSINFAKINENCLTLSSNNSIKQLEDEILRNDLCGSSIETQSIFEIVKPQNIKLSSSMTLMTEEMKQIERDHSYQSNLNIIDDYEKQYTVNQVNEGKGKEHNSESTNTKTPESNNNNISENSSNNNHNVPKPTLIGIIPNYKQYSSHMLPASYDPESLKNFHNIN